jgi:hypothetical protein
MAIAFSEVSNGALPSGVVFDAKKGIRMSGANARQLNDQAISLNRDKSVGEYISLLQSEDAADRCWAACALGRFQSESSLRALLTQIRVETSGPVLDEIYNQLNSWFEIYGYPGSTPAFGISRESALKQSMLWDTAYSQLGYLGLARHGWDIANSRGKAGKQFFLSAIEDRYDLQLVPFLVQVASLLGEANFRHQLATIILCWSGYDIDSQDLNQVKNELVSMDALSSAKVCERYHAYFQRLGYGSFSGSVQEMVEDALKAETKSDQKYLHKMATRMGSCVP